MFLGENRLSSKALQLGTGDFVFKIELNIPEML